MALDGIVTSAIAEELKPLIGARIHKIHQPNPRDLVLQIRGNGGQAKLLLSANPTYPRAHLTQQSFTNPLEAPMFCMLLRKYCEGGVIENIEQTDRERILRLSIRRRDELGDVSLKTIVVEIMGRHSNIILLDPATQTIHDGIHHVTPAISSYRIIMPGSQYTAPPEQHKADPVYITDKAAFEAALSAAAKEEPLSAEKRLVDAFSGISPLLAKEIAYRSIQTASANQPEEHGIDALWLSFNEVMQQVRNNNYTPVIATSPEGKSHFSITSLTHLNAAEVQSYETISACLEAFYGDKAERDTVKQRANDLVRFVQNEKNKNVKKIEKLKNTLEEAKDADKYRVLGELLTTCMHQIERGQKSVEVINYYEEEQPLITVALDPQLTPSENAQRYFKTYTKSKNSVVAVHEQIQGAENDIVYFDSLLQQLESAALSDLDEIRDELVEQSYLKARSRKGPKKKKAAKPSLLHYTSSEGIAILVGKNNTQNEYLTNRLAASSETWLHTKDIPGSHVVIRETNFGDPTLEEAAMLAAYYSQAKSSSMVPVDYTLIRHVRKPSGAKPGFVTYDHQKTLFITPDEQRIKALPCQVKT
ncbi:NFACT family protein [Paenibacillus sp. GCM10012307]|uniref:Rqc2 homolog RqcH n=1 Tax=Paenibacillus roseus TaxID=2798579 RepID=A0A934MMG4_9BACL|nr:NFACT RNA binding domain-containing protein [Paenibacillus roseus]MBJ6363295.1 NFACT family protein [Paenibacillus roseus]